MNTFHLLAAGETSGFQQFLPMILILIIFYFILIRPQSKARKELQARIDSIVKGDKVVTTGGIHGMVHQVSEKTVTLKIAEGILVKFEKPSIQVVNKSGKGAPKEEKALPDTNKTEG